MGVYILDYKEIADAMEDAGVEHHCEGDFHESEFIKGAKEYIKRLRKKGACIPK